MPHMSQDATYSDILANGACGAWLLVGMESSFRSASLEAVIEKWNVWKGRRRFGTCFDQTTRPKTTFRDRRSLYTAATLTAPTSPSRNAGSEQRSIARRVRFLQALARGKPFRMPPISAVCCDEGTKARGTTEGLRHVRRLREWQGNLAQKVLQKHR